MAFCLLKAARMLQRGLFGLILAGAIALPSTGCNNGGADPVNTCDGKCDGSSFDDLGDIEAREWEYIVVGSGAGGGPLAANLARQGHSVLLLEAGKDTGGKLEYQLPAIHPMATEEPGLAWWYFVDHYTDQTRAAQDSKYTTEGILYPRGGALGGSTAVNAMITVLPPNNDWNDIATLTGDMSWNSANMRQYFDRVKRWLGVERPEVSGAILDSTILAILNASFKEWNEYSGGRFLGSLDAMFRFLTGDINAALLDNTQGGVYMFPLATRDHHRNGTREYILSTVNDGRAFPLRVKTQALVTKVVWADEPGEGGPRAAGVEFLDGAHLYDADLENGMATPEPRTVTVRATREVILAAGVFNTPQLLMLSGVGARDELAQHGIETVVDLPGVGKNVQDRYEVGLVTELSRDFSATRDCTFSYDLSDPCFRSWSEDSRGVYTSNGGVSSILMKSSPAQRDPDLHIFALPGVFKGYYPGYSTVVNPDKRHFSWVILKGHTDNRGGTVKLKSANPRERPAVNFHYFDDGGVDQGLNDLTAVVNGVDFVRRLERKGDDLDLFTTHTEVWPGPDTDTREEIGEWVKKEAWGHHASCSAPIGADSDPMAVLDSSFRVRGTSGLRVVDASVFPRIPGTFIVLPIYMVSEKATDTLLRDIGEQRIDSNFP